MKEESTRSCWPAVLAVIVIAILIYGGYLLFSSPRFMESFKQGEDEEDVGGGVTGPSSTDNTPTQIQQQPDKETLYKRRLHVMKLFETLLGRAATNDEIEKYSAKGGEGAILAAISADYNLMNDGDTNTDKTVPDKHAPPPPPPPHAGHVRVNHEHDQDYQEEDEEEEEEEDNEEKKNDARAPLNSNTAAKGMRSDGALGFGAKFMGGDQVDMRGRVCVDKEDVLNRLKAASTELKQLYHLISMY